MLNSLNRREILGTFIGAFLGTLISYFTVGHWVGHLYTVAGALIGAALGYYFDKIFRSTIDVVENLIPVVVGALFFLGCIIEDKMSELAHARQIRQRAKRIIRLRMESWRRPHIPYIYTRMIRGQALRASGLLILGLYVLGFVLVHDRLSKFGDFLYWLSAAVSIAALWEAAIRMKLTFKAANSIPLGCRELIKMGPWKFFKKAFLVGIGQSAEFTLYLWPTILLIIVLGLMALALSIAFLCLAVVPLWALTFIFKLLVFAVTRRGHWFSFSVASITIFLSMWIRPWTGNETIYLALTIACMNGGISTLAGLLIRSIFQHIIGKHQLDTKNIKLDWAFEVILERFLKDEHWEAAFKWFIKFPTWMSKKVPLIPAYSEVS